MKKQNYILVICIKIYLENKNLEKKKLKKESKYINCKDPEKV
jgi:hypothetical protein